MNGINHLTAEDIYYRIISNKTITTDDYICIIAGRSGPTGKSWLTSRLNTKGYTAIEISEPLGISGAVSFNGDENCFIIDDFRKSVVIILNRILDFYEICNGRIVRKDK